MNTLRYRTSWAHVFREYKHDILTAVVACAAIVAVGSVAIADPTRGPAVGGSYGGKGSKHGNASQGTASDGPRMRIKSGSMRSAADTTERNNDKTTCGTKC